MCQDGYESIVGEVPSGIAECIAGVMLLSEMGDHGVLGDQLWSWVGLVVVR